MKRNRMVSMKAGTRGLLAGIALFAVACAAGSPEIRAEDENATVTVAAASTPEQIVAQYVEQNGSTYAGDCAATISPRDIGKTCSRFVEEQNGVRAYMTGRTFSEYSTWVFVSHAGGAWRLKSAAALDFFDMSDTIPWPR